MFENQVRLTVLFSLALFLCAHRVGAQQTPAVASSPNGSPSPTPPVFSPQTLSELKQLQKAALESDYAYRQVAHLSNNIGPRLSGSAQAAKAVEYVAAELKTLGCEVQLEKCMVPHWVRGVETGALIQFPGQAPNTTQKVVLCALGSRGPCGQNF
jgi:carboxypeptidase Q